MYRQALFILFARKRNGDWYPECPTFCAAGPISNSLMAKEERIYSSAKETYKLHLNLKNSIISFTYLVPLKIALQELTPQ
jgi:hypothetical protein